MRILTVLMMICACALATTAQADQPLTQNLPADTLAYLGWAGTQSLPFDGSMFGELLKEPAVGNIVKTLLDAGRKEIRNDQEKQAFDHAVAMAGLVWRRPVVVAWLGLEVSNDSPIPSAALLIDLGDEEGKKAFSGHLEAILQAVGKELVLTDATAGAVTYRKFRPGKKAPELAFGYIGNIFFFTIGDGTAAKLISVDPAKSLKTDKNFIARMAVVSGDNEQSAYYADITTIRKIVEPLVDPLLKGESELKLGEIIDLLGLGKATAYAGATRIVDKGMYSRSRIFSPQPHRGLLALYSGRALDEAALAGVPADADFVGAARISPKDVYVEVRRIIKTFSSETDAQIETGLEDVETMLGVELVRDVLDNLGDTFVLASAPSQGGFLTGTVLTVDIKNAKEFGAATAKIQAFFTTMLKERSGSGQDGQEPPVTIETIKADRTEIHYVRLAIDSFPVAVAPAWALHKGKLYIALWPQVIQTTIANTGKNPLMQDATFKKFRARVSKNASAITYTNTPKIVRQLYGFSMFVWTMAANGTAAEFGLNMKPDWLPALSRLEKYLWPQISAVSTDADGITGEQFGSFPFGNPVTSIGSTSVAVSILLPSLNKARGLAGRTKSMANLRSLGMGIHFYAEDNDDKLPPDLASLEDYISGTDWLVSPISGRTPPKIVDGKLVGKADYVYVLPGVRRSSIIDQQIIILAYERLENYHNEGTVILFADTHVEWMTRSEFEKALKRTTDAIQGRGANKDNNDF